MKTYASLGLIGLVLAVHHAEAGWLNGLLDAATSGGPPKPHAVPSDEAARGTLVAPKPKPPGKPSEKERPEIDPEKEVRVCRLTHGSIQNKKKPTFGTLGGACLLKGKPFLDLELTPKLVQELAAPQVFARASLCLKGGSLDEGHAKTSFKRELEARIRHACINRLGEGGPFPKPLPSLKPHVSIGDDAINELVKLVTGDIECPSLAVREVSQK